MDGLIKKLKKQIEKEYGKKCKDFDPFCANCIMWKAFETINEGFDYTKPKKKIDPFKLYGYKKWFDEGEDAEKLFKF
ncbi:MAG: hypothetical protein HOE11_00800 [Candidatus Diapherotrites archaeon]|jgi:hypothetical protein|nr:hypothetical protein [Candidatus Diapherotrites archaeon]MBT4596744.1 hypothetical protein [Candidatus Diapherotrites archaeon]